MLLITPPVTKIYMHFIFDYSIRSFKSASTQVVKTTNKLLNEGIFFNITRRSALLSLRGAALPHFLHMLFPTLLISSIPSKLTIFNKAIMHVVYPPQIFHNHCIQVLLGSTVVQEKLKTMVMKNLGV